MAVRKRKSNKGNVWDRRRNLLTLLFLGAGPLLRSGPSFLLFESDISTSSKSSEIGYCGVSEARNDEFAE
jgi:hypothetical protein